MPNTAEISDTGTLTVVHDDSRDVSTHPDLPAARRAAIEWFAEHAPREGLIVHSTDPEFPPGWIRIFPDKTVEPADGPEPEPEPLPQAQPIVLPSLAESSVEADGVEDEAADSEAELETPHEAHGSEPAIDDAAADEPLPAEAPEGPAPEPEESTPRPQVRQGETAAVFTDTRAPRKPLPAKEGLQGLLNRVTGGLLALPPSEKELTLRASTEAVQRGLSTHKTISFLNLKGGATKTTACYNVGAVLGRTRGGSVLAWDNNENKGTLAERSLVANHDHTAVDLLHAIDELDESAIATELMSFVRPQGSNHFDVLASQNIGSKAQVIDGEGFARLHRALRRFYRLILVDTGNASNADTWQGAVDASDAIVLCTLNREDVAKTAFATLDTLHRQGHGEKVANAVVVITETQRPNAERMRRMIELFDEVAAEVVQVPFDTHLDEGEIIEWDALSPATRTAYLHAAAAIMRRL